MSQIRIPSLALGLLLLLSLFVLGCGDKNSQADFDPASGRHLESWLPSGHTNAAKAHVEDCTECHGSDLSGGVAKIACTKCHLGSPSSPHPVFWNYTATKPTAWGTYAYAFHGAYAKQNTTKSCAIASCHGTDLQGVSGSGPSCTSCHKDVMSTHPVEWEVRLSTSPQGIPTLLPDHGRWVNETESASCRNIVCHGPQAQGVVLSGYACSACHNSNF